MPDGIRSWRWRNLRSAIVGFGIRPFPWQWRLSFEHVSKYYDWYVLIAAGPFIILIEADHGDCSIGDWRAQFGLSDYEAWERSE